ncbi:hypothetical protein [Aeromonas sp. QDB25]|uniref:hypothetical protein n=1 Tax=Aeromonas sp. QDB25 TaxID=2989832 RepID=UPI0022E91DEB|nr:hypothetical protein [Aeromonas sp. QDB25]
MAQVGQHFIDYSPIGKMGSVGSEAACRIKFNISIFTANKFLVAMIFRSGSLALTSDEQNPFLVGTDIETANSTPKCNTRQIKQPVVVHQTRSAVA